MGQCWSGLISSCRIRQGALERDGFLLEMNSMNFEEVEERNQRNIFVWGSEAGENFLKEARGPKYFTMEEDAASLSVESLCPEHSRLHSNANIIHKDTLSRAASYREILNPGHLTRALAKSVVTTSSGQQQSFPWSHWRLQHQGWRADSRMTDLTKSDTLQSSKHGSIASIELEWENEECLRNFQDRNRNRCSDSCLLNMEENGNTTTASSRWNAEETESSRPLGPLGPLGPSGPPPSGLLNRKAAHASRTSSESSLAWDTQNDQVLEGELEGTNTGLLDEETENLLMEIETLTATALRETAQWAETLGEGETPMSMSGSSYDRPDQLSSFQMSSLLEDEDASLQAALETVTQRPPHLTSS